MTIRLLSTYRQFKPNTNVTLASGTETALVAGGNATTDLSGGVPYDYKLPLNTRENGIAYAPDGVPLGIADSAGKIIGPFSGIAAPGAPTGLALTAIAGGVLATMTAPASNGGTGVIGYEVTLSTGQVQIGENTTITVNAPAGVAVTATAKAINGFDKSVASAASASATPTAFVTPAKPGAPTIGTLVAGSGKVTVNWTAAAANGSTMRNYLVTLSNGATAVAAGNATSIDVTTPNGVAVTATVRANNGEGAGPVSGVSNSVTPAVARVLRAVTTQNRIAPAQVTLAGGLRTRLAARQVYIVGSGDVDGIDFAWSYFIGTNPDIATLSPMVLSGVVAEKNLTEVGKLLNVKGQTFPYTLASGANEVFHETLLPSHLGLTVFTPGMPIYLKFYADFTPISGAITYPGQADRAANTDTTNRLWTIFDPTLIAASPILTPGRPTATLVADGTATTFPVTSGNIIAPFALGTFVNSRASRRPSYSAATDSNGQGFKSTLVSVHGKGEFQEFLAGDGSNGRLLAGINMGFTGSTIAQQSHDKIVAWHKYSDDIFDEVIANSFNTGATNYVAVQTEKQSLWTKLHTVNPGARIFSSDVGPHTTGAWTLPDQSDQTQEAGYGLGGNVNLFRTWHEAQVGQPNGIFKFFGFTTWRAGPDVEKWTPLGTDDGTHGNNATVTAKSVELAVQMPIA